MFDWLPGLYWSATGSFFMGCAAGAIPAFLLGICFWQGIIARREARQLAKDIEARIAQCPDEVEVEEVWMRLLKSCDL
jgi:hypothetical protein